MDDPIGLERAAAKADAKIPMLDVLAPKTTALTMADAAACVVYLATLAIAVALLEFLSSFLTHFST